MAARWIGLVVTWAPALGLGVGNGEHHAVGMDPAGKRLHDGPLPNSEPKLWAGSDKLATQPLLVDWCRWLSAAYLCRSRPTRS